MTFVDEHGVEAIHKGGWGGRAARFRETPSNGRRAIHGANGIELVEPRYSGFMGREGLKEEGIQLGPQERSVARRYEQSLPPSRLGTAKNPLNRTRSTAAVEHEANAGQERAHRLPHSNVCDGNQDFPRKEADRIHDAAHHGLAADFFQGLPSSEA